MLSGRSRRGADRLLERGEPEARCMERRILREAGRQPVVQNVVRQRTLEVQMVLRLRRRGDPPRWKRASQGRGRVGSHRTRMPPRPASAPPGGTRSATQRHRGPRRAKRGSPQNPAHRVRTHPSPPDGHNRGRDARTGPRCRSGRARSLGPAPVRRLQAQPTPGRIERAAGYDLRPLARRRLGCT